MSTTGEDLEQFTATDTGGRNPTGWEGKLIFWIALIWALFQLYIASNVPFLVQETIGFGVVTNSNARLFHLSFGINNLIKRLFRRYEGMRWKMIPSRFSLSQHAR